MQCPKLRQKVLNLRIDMKLRYTIEIEISDDCVKRCDENNTEEVSNCKIIYTPLGRYAM